MQLAEFLEACHSAEKALSAGSDDAARILAQCMSAVGEMTLNEQELRQAGEALIRLRSIADAKADVYAVRGRLSKTLVHALGGDVPAKPRIDKTF